MKLTMLVLLAKLFLNSDYFLSLCIDIKPNLKKKVTFKEIFLNSYRTL